MIKALFGLNLTYLGTLRGIFLCCCHIPPEDCNVHKDIWFTIVRILSIHFFYTLEENICHFSQLVDVLLCGDLNSRTGHRRDFVENIYLQRYVNMPDDTEMLSNLPLRTSISDFSNTFGNNMQCLCKQSGLSIMNGRLQPAHFNCYNLVRNIMLQLVL